MNAVFQTQTMQEYIVERIKVDSHTGCWNWLGSGTVKRPKSKYGCIRRVGLKTTVAHRISYEHFIGPIAKDLVLDHICSNKYCVNPWHLSPTTVGENVRREFLRRNGGLRTHCNRGHEYTKDNTYVYKKRGKFISRQCRKCMDINWKASRARRF